MSDLHSWRKAVLGSIPRDALIALTACLCYSVCSMAMTLTNKAMLSTFSFKYPLSLLMYQHIFTLIFLTTARYFGFIQYQNVNWETATKWYPVNVLFILMLASGSYALKLLSIPMVTIFKNITTSLVTIGDFMFFGENVTQGIFFSVTLMIVSSVVAALNDLAFDGVGYTWMIINCLISACYVLYMRLAIKKTRLSEWGMVYYNNLLAIPTLLPILYLNGELPELFYVDSSMWTSGLLFMTFLSGISGVLISVTSFWAVKSTSPTTYSIVGTLNKIPLTILGFLFFHSPVTTLGAMSISIGLIGGFVFSYAKQQANRLKEVLPTLATPAKHKSTE